MTTVRELTNRHRAQQSLLAKSVDDAIASLWPLLAWDDLDGSFPAFFAPATTLVGRERRTSIALASSYLKAARVAAGLRGVQQVIQPDDLPEDQVLASLHSTSVAALKNAAGNGIEPALAMRNALTLTQGASQRLALDGGRQTITRTAGADQRIVGWRRVGVGECNWCALLIGRGSVYREDTVDFEAHGGCRCSGEPVYTD